MKKLIAITLVLVIALSLAACGGGGSSSSSSRAGSSTPPASSTPPTSSSAPVAPSSTPEAKPSYEVDLSVYEAAEILDIEYIQDWMLPSDGVVTVFIDNNGYCQIDVGGIYQVELDKYVEQLKSNGMEAVDDSGKKFSIDETQVEIVTTLMNEEPYEASKSFISLYIYDMSMF